MGHFLLLDVFLSLVKDDEPFYFGMISHLLWHLAGTHCAKTEFLEIIVILFHLESVLNIPCMYNKH